VDAPDLVDLHGLDRRSGPRILGDYTLLEVLGRGGMGMVWRASRRTDIEGITEPCVVKTLRANDDPEYERRFIDEVRLLVLLAHQNICAVLDAGCFEGQYYLAMEHIDGLDLKRVTAMTAQTGAPLPTAVVVYVVRAVLEALDAAHRTRHPVTKRPLKVVHRDVSPQNVMLAHDGRVKLIDFGLALSTQKVEKTAPSIVMGKLAYMSPEQARGEPVDGRADQFAVGVMLYELLANARYYEGLTVDATWRKSGSGGHEPARWASIDDGLRAIIRRSTAPVAADRYDSCAAMANALAAWASKNGQEAGPAEAASALRTLVAGGLFLDGPTGKRQRVTSLAGRHAVVADAGALDAGTPRPRERTRTFRLSELDGASSDGSSDGSSGASSGDGAGNLAGAAPRGAEPTVVVRAPWSEVSATRDAATVGSGDRRRLAAAVGAVVLFAGFAVAFVLAARNDAGPGTVLAPVVPGTAGVVEAGALDAPVIDDAGTPAPQDTGTITVDAGTPARTDVAPARPSTPRSPGKNAVRPLPPWPAASVLRQAAVLRDHCRDVPCTAPLLQRLARPDGPGPQALERELRTCYAACKRAPSR
jgi:tRNA A-37 threonylcarbamoyl transferase component Bud32